ncbi:hypothetical protein B0H21DRAFT_808883 [Amylocystis lapponica]|nr:hypothetical protein B0H21DRAFT_808883 [Amylocystis lapponica]
MAQALAGDVSFTAGTPFEDLAALTLEDVLSGAGLFDAAVGGPQEDEMPGILDDSDLMEDFVSDSEAASNSKSAEEISGAIFGTSNDRGDYFPYPNKAMMKTDILFSSPRLRFSRAQQEAILAWGKDLGARDVPSHYRIEKFQKEALEAVGNPTVKVTAASGNVFYVNTVTQAMVKDYAHPETRKLIHAYPEFTHNKLSEVWQASKWLVDAPDEVLTPMVRLDGKDYYINELTRCVDDAWFIPLRFFDMDGAKWAVGRKVQAAQDGLHVSEDHDIMDCAAFRNNWPDIENWNPGGQIFAPQSAQYAALMPNPDRELAAGLEWECPPIVLFIDDVSGNSTKQWNVHYSCYMSNGGLPRSAVEKDCHIQFVATSPHASPMEIVQAICDEIRSTGGKTPIKTWDSVRNRYILIRPWLLFLPGDNPMQAELCSHIGLTANFFCRCCHAGGTKLFKESDEGFASLLQTGRLRSVDETREAVLQQLVLATHAAAAKPLQEAMTASGVKDSLAMPIINRLVAIGKALRRSTSSRKALTPEAVNQTLYEELLKRRDTPVMNPLLGMKGLDPHKDTPVEPLHTLLLGIVKYFWAQTVWILQKQGKFAEFNARLNSLARAGLKIPNIMGDYMCRYRGSLIGKHFKTISQVMAFAICGLVEEPLQNTWYSIGRLTVLIWDTAIEDVQSYMHDLRQTINTVNDFAAKLSPSLLTLKNKFHIFGHIPDHILRFGPALLFSTERYESFNHIFRLCSIHSNRQAPSRDIAVAFANQARCRHMTTGGYWLDARTKRWVCSGREVQRHLQEHRVDAHLLGVDLPKPPRHGTITISSESPVHTSSSRRSQVRTLVSRHQTSAAHLESPLLTADGKWFRGDSLVTTSGDVARLNDEVIVKQHINGASCLSFASILELLSPSEARDRALVIVRMSQLQTTAHNTLKLPVIQRIGELTVLEPSDITCVVNVQHDCASQGCMASGQQRLRQERELTSQVRTVVEHRDTISYVVNTHSLHNQQHLRRALPPHLLMSPSFFADRLVLHREAAASLRDHILQKKLARDAAVRKRAEDALRLANQGGSMELSLLDDESTHAGHSSWTDPDHDELPGGGDNRKLIFDDTIVAPRGPRQRRGGGNVRAAEPEMPDQFSNSTGRGLAGQKGTQARGGRGSSGGARGGSGRSQRRGGRTKGTATQLPAASAHSGGHESMAQTHARLVPSSSSATAVASVSVMSGADSNTFTSQAAAGFSTGSDGLPQLRNDAKQKAQECGLAAEQTAEVVKFCDLSLIEMVIDLKTHLLKNENDLLKRYFRIFVRHPDFALRLRHVVAAILLAPNTPAYHSGILNQVANHIEKNLDWVGLPASCKRDPADWALVKSAISHELAQMRSSMKSKLDMALKNKQDIYLLTTALMMYEMRAKREHWGRVAFLRSCASSWNQLTAVKKKATPFWDHVDQELKSVRATMNETYVSADRRRVEEAKFFADMVLRDVQTYAVTAGQLQMAVHTNDTLTDLQRNAEQVAGTFIAENTPAGAANADDDVEDLGLNVETGF